MSPLTMDVSTKATSWSSLPFEIRQMILSLVALPKSAPFTAVCREWQVFFEARTFRRLVLNADSLSVFDTIVRRRCSRLGYIRKLWLRVQLSTYDCPDCDELEDEATQHCNNKIFTMCIQSLLDTLKLWDPARHGEKGLTLMLSASSPSDTEHRFNRCEIKDDYPFHYAEDLDLAPGIVDFHRTNRASPFSLHFHRCCPPPLYSEHVKRVQGTPLSFGPQTGGRGCFASPYKRLPAVPMVKGLVMRRQFRREIHVGTLAWLLGQSFVALEWFRFERTVSPEPHKQLSFDQGFQLQLLPSLPKTLRQFSFTQWEIPKNERLGGLEELEWEISPHTQAYLPREMAKLAQRLEQFCPPWQMDSIAFLQSIIELRESSPEHEILESSLKRIILRCSLLSPEKSRQYFELQVILAARAALSFPQLEVIELCGTCLDGQQSRAYIFRYSYKNGRASIVWRSSEHEETVKMAAQGLIIDMWNEVAHKHSYSSCSCPTLVYNLHVVPLSETKAEISKSDGTCIYRHLLLKDLVFDPITQIILENEPYRWSLDQKSDSWQQGDA